MISKYIHANIYKKTYVSLPSYSVLNISSYRVILCRQWRKNKKFFWNLQNFEKCDYGVCCNEKWAVMVVQMFLYLSYLRHGRVWTSIWYFLFKIETKLYYQLCYDRSFNATIFIHKNKNDPYIFYKFFYTSY